MTDNREVGGDQEHPKCETCGAYIPEGGEGVPEICPACMDKEDEAARFSTLTPAQAAEREDIVKALGQRCNALMRYDGKDPALVASALLWCGISMYVQGAPELTREGMLLVCGSTFDEAKKFIEDAAAVAQKKGDPNGQG